MPLHAKRAHRLPDQVGKLEIEARSADDGGGQLVAGPTTRTWLL